MFKVILTSSLTLGIIALGLIWISSRPKNDPKAFFNKSAYRRQGFIFISLLLTFISGVFFPIPAYSGDELLTTTGIIAYGFGFVLAVTAKMEMNHIWGMPAQHDIERQNKLIKTGPFSVSRNPIYVGLLLVFFGYALALKSYGILIGFYYLYFVFKAVKKEEQLLERYFGMEYIAYKSKVPRFIPFFWK